ncbi:MAG: phosphate--AMP phosphotransferase [Eubacteriales bacterium]|nr:phosphate--AMP phosphotransferase [Eubacteriales bacterium]
MLEQIDLSKKMSKEEKKRRMEVLQPELGRLQRQLKEAGIPVMIVFEGFGAAGKGYQIAQLIEALDPRGFYVNSTASESEEERMHPFLWRFWTKIPAKGQIAVFDRGWYRKVLLDRFDKTTPENEVAEHLQEINSFERQLTADGTVLIKLFLCIDKKEQKRRFEKLMNHPETAWRVTKDDLKRNRHFGEYKRMNDEMLEATDTDCASWMVIESMDREFATVKIYTAVISALRQALLEKEERVRAETTAAATAEVATGTAKSKRGKKKQTGKPEEEMLSFDMLRASSLDKADLTLSLDRTEYKRELDALQKRIEVLHSALYRKHIPVVIAFEGWDAAGKGGAIKRLTSHMDPRGYRVNPTASPNDFEKVHHYLWRFWRNMPKDGHIAVFDRTWYGRVMVERVEHFATDEEWQRAYQEINEMEKQLCSHGTVILKFWMQISKDEQEKRFRARMEDPDKRWKITDEDWRNREKWDAYKTAVDEMLMRTSTTYAPWIIVEGNDKYYARVKVLRKTVEALEAALKRKA